MLQFFLLFTLFESFNIKDDYSKRATNMYKNVLHRDYIKLLVILFFDQG